MKKHEIKTNSEPKQAQDEVSGKADDIQQKEGHPQEHEMHNSSKAETKIAHAGADQPEHMDHVDRHARMAMDFRKRFWILLALTLPNLHLRGRRQNRPGDLKADSSAGDVQGAAIGRCGARSGKCDIKNDAPSGRLTLASLARPKVRDLTLIGYGLSG